MGVFTALVDVPADFLNAATGTGNNLGLAGELDRALDPRDIDQGDVPDPTPENTGFAGFIRGTFGAGGAAVGEAAQAAAPALLRSPTGLLALVLALVYLFGQLFEINIGGEA
jgi:hypothetical protein